MTRYTECMAQVAVTSEPLDVHALTREVVRLKPDTTCDDEESVRLKRTRRAERRTARLRRSPAWSEITIRGGECGSRCEAYAPRRARAVADCRGSTDSVADRSSGYSPSNRTAGHRRGQRNHRGHVAASRDASLRVRTLSNVSNRSCRSGSASTSRAVKSGSRRHGRSGERSGRMALELHARNRAALRVSATWLVPAS